MELGRDESGFVFDIVKEVEKMQSPLKLHVTDYPVGIRSRVDQLISKLRLDSKDVVVVAVWGCSGIGKSTIVRATYNRIAAQFDVCCFLANIHNHCLNRDGEVKLQQMLISCLTQNDKLLVDGVTKIRKLIHGQKVLLVLDDIDTYKQLDALGIQPKYFYDGSRIIVTTRDRQSLGLLKDVVSYHTIMLLNHRESLNLFTRILFGRAEPENTKFIEEVVDRAKGLPLVLKVWSCHFKQFGREQWPSILETLKRIPHGDVQKQLQLSYDALSYRSKKLFLDAACFFYGMEGMEKDLVVKVLEDKDSAFFTDIELQYLIDKCLLEIDDEQRLYMNHAIEEMGHEVVRQENEDEPGKRTRLMNRKDVVKVLLESSGTASVECIRLDDNYEAEEDEELIVQMQSLRKMTNLRLVKLYYPQTWTWSDDDSMPSLFFNKLKYLEWPKFPLKSISKIDMSNVVVILLQCSKLETLWVGFKRLKKLRILDVIYSRSLTTTGSFDGLENLEELHLRGCKNLEELHHSISLLTKLTQLDLHGCEKLGRFPMEIIGMRNLSRLSLDYCKVSQVPNEIEKLVSLEQLSLSGNPFCSLPDSFSNLPKLVYLWIVECSQLQSLPPLPSSLTRPETSSLDVMPMEGAYIFRTNAFKESWAFIKPFVIYLSTMEIAPDWVSGYWNQGDDELSCVAPTHRLDKICGIILCVTGDTLGSVNPEMFNVTKGTSHCLRIAGLDMYESRSVVFYPLDDTTLVVEAGDTLVFTFDDTVHGFDKILYLGGGLRWIYEGDVVDSAFLLH